MTRTIERATREWVEAEWDFRLGRRAYSAEAQDKLVRAERRLRRVVSGRGGLDEAYRELREELHNGYDGNQSR